MAVMLFNDYQHTHSSVNLHDQVSSQIYTVMGLLVTALTHSVQLLTPLRCLNEKRKCQAVKPVTSK